MAIKADEISKELKNVWGDDSPTTRSVYKWISDFKGNIECLSDLPGRGRSITATFKHNIAAAKAFINEDPYATYDETEVETSLSRGKIFTILHYHLNMRKIISSWVPHELTEHKKKKEFAFAKKIRPDSKPGSGDCATLLLETSVRFIKDPLENNNKTRVGCREEKVQDRS